MVPMDILDKFYTDIQRAGKQGDDAVTQKFISYVTDYSKSLNGLAYDMVSYWEKTYKGKKTDEENAEWFYTLFCFLTCRFQEDQTFSHDDWQELHDSISAAQDDLDIDLLTEYMKIFLGRGRV